MLFVRVVHLQDDSHGTTHLTFDVDGNSSSFRFRQGGWHVRCGHLPTSSTQSSEL